MCVPGCQEIVRERLSRRGFFKGSAAVAAGAAATFVAAPARQAKAQTFSRVVDLTHPLPPDFPTYFGEPGLRIEELFNFAQNGFNLNMWHLNEHTGTHMDAPLHFSADGLSTDEISVDNLVVPLAVIDITAKAEADPDAEVTVEDITAWEERNGTLPEGCCVALRSGWDGRAPTEAFRNADADGVMHFPGFSIEATTLMLEQRNVAGMAVDTLSLDHGPSQTFDTHYAWLPTGRWGLECLANLGDVPEDGATLVVGAPKIVGASGGPSRLFALVP